jgi:menaquinone-dependent protoporphyrinogen oxidase
MPLKNMNENNNKMRALIIYGTRWGSTTDIARRVSETLKTCGYTVDVINAKNKTKEIETYNLIIIGSSISMGKWTKETKTFLKKNASKMKNKKTALFVSCGLILRQGGLEKAREDYLRKVADKYSLNPVSFGAFGGFLNFKTSHGILGDLFVNSSKKRLKEIGVDTSKPYDFRNWTEIETWTRSIA